MRVADGGFYDGVAKLITHHTSITQRNTHSICRKYYAVNITWYLSSTFVMKPRNVLLMSRRASPFNDAALLLAPCQLSLFGAKAKKKFGMTGCSRTWVSSIGPWSVVVMCWRNGGVARWFIDARGSSSEMST